MFFNRKKKANHYVKAKTPEARKLQQAAIAAYYKKKREDMKKK